MILKMKKGLIFIIHLKLKVKQRKVAQRRVMQPAWKKAILMTKPPKKLRKKMLACPKTKLKWKKKGRNWTTLNEFVDHDEKLQLNMPEDTLTRFSSSTEFPRLFFTKDLSEIIFDQTKLYDE